MVAGLRYAPDDCRIRLLVLFNLLLWRFAMNARLCLVAMVVVAWSATAADWPQWRGPNRDARAAGFEAPKTWPKELTQKWKVTVGDGVSSPALVGDKLYVFSRESGNEVIRCLQTADGKEVWKHKYEAAEVGRPAQNFTGPRSSPAVAEGKVVTLGVHGKLSCLDAATGKEVWRKDTRGEPRFATSCSPLIVDGLCIIQIGSESAGGIYAYELANGNEKWKWTDDGTTYASPVLIDVGGKKAVVTETTNNVVAVGVTDGKLLWKTPFPTMAGGGKGGFKGGGKGGKGGGGGLRYNAATPIVDGTTIIYTGTARGTKAVKVEPKGAEFASKELWSNPDNSGHFNSPVIKNGRIFGLTESDKLYCINAENGKTEWTTNISGRRGYGSVVDVGPVLLALTPSAELIVFEPTDREFKQIAKYKVGTDTYAYPVVARNRIFIKDKDSVTLWVVE
jgi:outer membrane protein assembly factor BamB